MIYVSRGAMQEPGPYLELYMAKHGTLPKKTEYQEDDLFKPLREKYPYDNLRRLVVWKKAKVNITGIDSKYGKVRLSVIADKIKAESGTEITESFCYSKSTKQFWDTLQLLFKHSSKKATKDDYIYWLGKNGITTKDRCTEYIKAKYADKPLECKSLTRTKKFYYNKIAKERGYKSFIELFQALGLTVIEVTIADKTNEVMAKYGFKPGDLVPYKTITRADKQKFNKLCKKTEYKGGIAMLTAYGYTII